MPKATTDGHPLQNSLLELFGLVSIIDDRVFGDLESFKEQFLKSGHEELRNRTLRDRLRPLCIRTLRKQVLEYIRYTQRISITQDFTPSDEEQLLYDQISAYLRRPELLALPTSQRALITMVLRKLLASSSFAIAGALKGMAQRLEDQQASLEADFEVLGELADEWDPEDGPQREVDPVKLAAELADLQAYAHLAETIQDNAKGGGRGVRAEERTEGLRMQALPGLDTIHINIFNISKINTEVRGGASPRIKRLAEYIGQSYFDYLAELPDLVLIMDEAHRYRAAAGMRAINELKPILGLELTATPFIEGPGTNRTPFKNVVYEYALANAMRDGFVKEPAVATRANFRASDYTEAQLETLKLQDGVLIHEITKVELATYALQHGVRYVKPFMLVVAQDTAHAEELMATIKRDDFFKGDYKDRVITVHSNQRGEESEATVARLLAVEDPEEPTEIVIHVSMLKEGWDVTNLYTIVPLRKFGTKNMVEQSIGRGLRLPYGKRTGNPAVDTLTIVAHDHFQEIIDHAKDADSVIRKGLIIGRDIPLTPQKVVVVPTRAETLLLGAPIQTQTGSGEVVLIATDEAPMFRTEADQALVKATLAVLPAFERLRGTADLRKPEVMAQFIRDVEAACPIPPTPEGAPPAEGPIPDRAAIVRQVVDVVVQESIDIPKVIWVPKGEVSTGFNDFDLDCYSIKLKPVDQPILMEALRTNERRWLEGGLALQREKRMEDYLVRELMNRDEISYDDHAGLLYKLAGQMVGHLQTYLTEPEDVVNVLQAHQKQLGDFIYAAMDDHSWEASEGSEPQVTRGFKALRAQAFQAPAEEEIRPFRNLVANKQDIPRMIFGGFKRCLFPIQKFGSDAERILAVILENEREDLRWVKPARGQFPIHYRFERMEHQYKPDFVVETETGKFILEPKQASQVEEDKVQAKATAARGWCQAASEHGRQFGGKPWTYVLIPHDAIQENMTLKGLVGAYGGSLQNGL